MRLPPSGSNREAFVFRGLFRAGVAAVPAGLVCVPLALLADPASAAVPSADPAFQALMSSVAPLEATSHHVVMTAGHSTITASVDPPAGIGTLTDQMGSSRFDETVTGGQVWLKLNIDPNTNKELGVSPTTWLKLDMSKLPKNNALPIPPDGSDPIDMPGILQGVTKVTHNSNTLFTGTIDLTMVAGRDKPDAAEVKRAGAAAKHVPFTATTDASNRITEFNADANAFDPSLSADVKYTGYGVKPTVKAPASSVPAPAAIYAVLQN
jgi:hypothetical protein